MTLTHKATAIAVAATLAVSGSGLAAVAAGTNMERANADDTTVSADAMASESTADTTATDAATESPSDTPSDGSTGETPSDSASSDTPSSDATGGTGDTTATDDTVTVTSQDYGTLDGTLTSDTDTDGHKHYTYDYTYQNVGTQGSRATSIADAQHGWDTTVSAFGQSVTLDPFKDAKIDFDSQSAKDALAKFNDGETVKAKEFPAIMTTTLTSGTGDTLTANIRIDGTRYVDAVRNIGAVSLTRHYSSGKSDEKRDGSNIYDAPVVTSVDTGNGTITMTGGCHSRIEMYGGNGWGKFTGATAQWTQFNPNAEQRTRTVSKDLDLSDFTYSDDQSGASNNELFRRYKAETLTEPAADTADGYSYAYGPYTYHAQDMDVYLTTRTLYTVPDGTTLYAQDDSQDGVAAGRVTLRNWAVGSGKNRPTLDHKPDSTLTVTGNIEGADTTESVTLTDSGTSAATDGPQLGQATVKGTAKYKHDADTSTKPDEVPWPAIDIEDDYEYVDGDAITLKDGTAFTRDSDGTWTAAAPNVTLGTDNKPDTQSVTLSNGDTAPIAWDAQPTVVEKTVNDKTGKHTVRFVTLKGTAKGTVTVHGITQSYTVNVTADRQEDTHFTITGVRETKADGTTADTPITFDTGTQSYEVTLPYSELTGAYSLLTDSGPDATVGDATQTLGDGASRIITVEANGTRYTVTVRFAAADIQPDSPAKLEGIYVNKTGERTKGVLIDGWDPNRLDYTLTVGENDPSPYILPVAGDGVTVSAGDVEQTADAAKQSWTVTDKASGASRTYTVTVLRSHSWKTAVEQFTPPTVDARPQTVAPDSDSDATLVSHGWTDKDGKYHTEDADEYTVDEGGAFAYEAKKGQSVSVSVARKGGMTFEYTVTVLPVDTSLPPAQYVYTVTFLTAATHSAQLTGIAVDGVEIPGFSPDTTSYEVQVNDPDEWTVAPLYDRTTGMSVKTSKEGDTATITVTSGDGLVQTVYTVHVTRKPLAVLSGAQGTVGVGGELAQTGSGVLGVVAASLAALLGGVGVSLVVWLRKRRYSVNCDGTARG